jgi:hypothetical protein
MTCILGNIVVLWVVFGVGFLSGGACSLCLRGWLDAAREPFDVEAFGTDDAAHG